MAPTTSNTKKKEKEAKKAKSSPQKEKRLLRYRSSCPAKLSGRIDRAATQRLYLVQQQFVASGEPIESIITDEDCETTTADLPDRCDFTIMGSTGNLYTVKLQQVPCCNCPDFERTNDLCKHILFVLLKVVGLDRYNDHRAYQKALLPSELQDLFRLLRERRVGGSSSSVMANASVRASYQALKSGDPTHEDEAATDNTDGVQRRSLEEDSDCPICFDAMMVSGSSAASSLVYCQAACGTNFHKDCICRWFRNQSHHTATCPNCRQEWYDPKGIVLPKSSSNSKGRAEEGYVNLGRLQGQSPERDNASYRRRW